MTAPRDRLNPTETRRADHNREKRLEAIQLLQRLLDEAAAPAFSGTVGVEVSVHEGYFTRVHDKRIRYH